jgi:mRNA-degrading endonuclease toxin of MazEF toxin-antitoxin module
LSERFIAYLKKNNEDYNNMVDQLRVIDNRRLIKRAGIIPDNKIKALKLNLSSILDLLE